GDKDSFGYNFVAMQAMADGNIECLKALLDAGVTVNLVESTTGNSLLHVAVSSGNLDSIILLLSYNPDLSIRNHKEETPIHLAFNNRLFDIITLLVNANDAVNRYRTFYNNILECALRVGAYDCAKTLIKHGAQLD